ncbi:MAG TPA: hypothetical protein VGK46_01695 [Saprospiraceae bacterium]
MFLKINLAIILLMGFAFISCSSRKEFPVRYKGDQIHFGQGGGFTGGVTYYALLDNGRLYQLVDRDTIFTYQETWKEPFTTQVFLSYETLQLEKISYYEPGDIYYFLEHKKSDGQLHRITWGRNGFVPDPKVVNFYNLLYKSTKTKS